MKFMEILRAATAVLALSGAWWISPLAWAQQERPEATVVFAGSRSFLGVAVVEVTAERAKALNVKEVRGVEITRLEDGSPAAKAGLKVGDAVLEYGGTRVEGVEQFIRMVRETPVGREVKLTISRAGQIQTLTASIAARKMWTTDGGDMHIAIPRIEGPAIRIPDLPSGGVFWRGSMLGVEAESLNSQLAEFFGVKEGVLIRSVGKGSAAEKAGMRAGDVITKVDDRKVASPAEVTRALRSMEKKTASVVVVREKREMTLDVTIEEAGDSARPGSRAVRAQDF